MTLYYPPPPFWDGRLEHGTAESCVDVTGHVEKTYDMIGLIDYLLGDYTNGASNIYDNISTTSRVPTSYPSTVPAAHEPGTRSSNYFDDALMSSGHVRARVVAPSRNTSPRSHLRPSFFATVSWPPPPPSSCRRADDVPAGRRGHVRTAVPPPRLATARWFDTKSTERPSFDYLRLHLHSVGTNIYPQHISLHQAQHRADSLAVIEQPWLFDRLAKRWTLS